ncbi:signal peptidase I [Rhabdobacter roseus]|uniref:Signal peptidase I n=1 Tax=Rhabdobacter roseus TaxID=1655419 RepID=A0A840TJE8_9BACT|nr:signal peptidase I [Rhabdobacter roseus]MBB5283531.1 signal peptidase I [Rhabdobacter roseus]
MHVQEKVPPPVSVKKKKKSATRDWLDSVVFAVVAATLIRFLFFEPFMIPTPSMENSLLVGDYLFVSKMHYGSRTPTTPLQVPLTHQNIWGTSLPAYLDWIRMPQFRLPGFSEVKRGDVVVFNLPVEHPQLVGTYAAVLPNLTPHPLDLRTNYVKRCVGQPGDTLQLRDSQLYINGVQVPNQPRLQHGYLVVTAAPVNENRVFRENGISAFSSYTEFLTDSSTSQNERGYLVHTTEPTAARLREYDFIKEVRVVRQEQGTSEPGLYPNSPLLGWNRDSYGPLVVPSQGKTVALTPENIALYGDIIQSHEGLPGVLIQQDNITIDGKAVEQYTFKQDYYFMMGDNRHNSADSRYWGFVPKDHIVGKAVLVWMSIDPAPTNFLNKIRWNRLFRVIQ